MNNIFSYAIYGIFVLVTSYGQINYVINMEDLVSLVTYEVKNPHSRILIDASYISNMRPRSIFHNIMDNMERKQLQLNVCTSLKMTMKEYGLHIGKFHHKIIPQSESRIQYQGRSLKSYLLCILCNKAIYVLKKLIEICPNPLVHKFLLLLCINLGITSKEVCKGVVNFNADILTYIIGENPQLPTEVVCGIVFQKLGCSYPFKNDWHINIPPPLLDDNLQMKKSRVKRKPIKILHLTDIHVDETYLPGSNNKCKDPLCCSKYNGPPQNREDRAGYWGDYNPCDLPWHSLINCLRQTKIHDSDMIYFTGDIVSHRIWNTSETSNKMIISEVYKVLRKMYPNVKIYPAIGNHETHPVNVFAFDTLSSRFSIQWLYDHLAKLWSVWLPKSALETVKKGGYYTVMHNDVLRIVVINSNVAYTFNWWLINSRRDPYGQLQWLADVLSLAEQNREVVHIVHHCPTGNSEMFRYWSAQYAKIILRFYKIIAGQFVGHSHLSELHLYYDEQKRVKNVAFNGGSMTPYEHLNPNYRIYTVSSNNWKVKDYEDWTYNLTLANEVGQPQWFRLYSLKTEFDMNSLSLNEFERLVKRIATDDSMALKYQRVLIRNSDSIDKCHKECRRENLCRMLTMVYGESNYCNSLF